MKSTILRYGVRAGVLLVVLSWASFYITKSSGVTTAQIASMGVVLFALGFVPLAIRSVRQQNGQLITFWMAFFTGALTTTIPAFFMFVSTVVFMKVQRAAFVEWSVDNASTGIDVEIAAVIMNPFEQGVIMFLTVMIIGTFIALISAVLLHRSKAE